MAQFSWHLWLRTLAGGHRARRSPVAHFSLSSTELLEARVVPTPISLVKDIIPGTGSGLLPRKDGAHFQVAGNLEFFVGNNDAHGAELWKTDGTSAGTAMVVDLTPGPSDSHFGGFSTANGKLFFEFNDGVHGNELWISDGTQAGTHLLKDINPTGDGMAPFGTPSGPVEAGGLLYFLANDGVHGQELWKSDGTENGTVMIGDLVPDTPYVIPLIDSLYALGNQLYFSLYDGVHGQELWVTDGSAAGTHLVKDINPGGYGSLLDTTYVPYHESRSFANLNGTLYFLANDGVHGRELWKTDGTEANTALVQDISQDPQSDPPHTSTRFRDQVAAGNQIFFIYQDADHGAELWKTDGSANGAVLVKDINPNGDAFKYNYGANYLFSVNGMALFFANDSVHGQELWKSDGTSEGTVMVADIAHFGQQSESAYISYGTVAGGQLYFVFNDFTHGYEVWKSDGTAAGTGVVQDLRPNGQDGVNRDTNTLRAFGDSLLFVGNNGSTGNELYIVNASIGGQQPVISNQSFNLAENSAANTVVGTVVASDPGNETLHYSITSGNGAGAFSIDSSSGQIKVADASALDFETHPAFALTVTVTNTSDQAASATITINLTDVNDPPAVTASTFDLDINSVHGAAVGTVNASDADAGQLLTYSITNGNTSNAFAIDPATGAITVDNAAALGLNVNPIFTLSILVTDNGVPPKMATGTVTINLFDPNDINDVPLLALNGFSPVVTKKGGPVPIAHNLTVTDPDVSAAFRLAGGSLIYSIDMATKKKKIFDTIGGITNVSGIGTIASNQIVEGRLQVTINLGSNATAAAIQDYLRGLTFGTKGPGFKIPARTFKVQVTDNAGAASNLLEQTVTVQKKAPPI